MNDPARATYRATLPSTPTQSHKQEALRSKHVKQMTSPQRIHLVIATAVHGVRQPPIRKSRHARPTLSNIWDLPRVGPSATRTMALPHCPARCRHCQGAACLTWCSKLAAPPAKSTVAGSERPTVLKAAACSHHAARRVGSAPMIDAAAKLASAIVAAARRPLAWSRRPMSSAREPCCH